MFIFFVNMFFNCILSLKFAPISLISSSIASLEQETSSGRPKIGNRYQPITYMSYYTARQYGWFHQI